MSRPPTWGERLALRHRRRRPYEMDRLPGSEAAEAARAYEVDRVQQARDRTATYGDGRYPALEAELRRLQERFEREGDVVPEIYARIRDEVIRDLDRRRCRRDPERVLVQSTDDPSVNALYRPFADGTGLIQVCEGLSALTDLLSKQLVLSSGLSAGRLPLLSESAFARAAATRCREDEYSFAVDVSLLRWTLLHQRFYGTSSSMYRRLTDAQQRAVDSIDVLATRFVVAHECAHHHLGHPGAGAAGVDDVALENEADDAALDALVVGGPMGTIDTVGAVIAVLAVECFDAVSVVRSAHTHPAPADRVNRILERVPPARRAIVVELVDRVRRVVDRARSLTSFVDASWWKTMIEHPDVLLEPRTENDVQGVFETDRLATGPLDNAERLLGHLGEATRIDLVSVAQGLRSGPWPAGLTGLSMTPRQQSAIADHDRPLSFSLLVRASSNGLARLGLGDPTCRHVAAVTVARLIEHRIVEETARDGR